MFPYLYVFDIGDFQKPSFFKFLNILLDKVRVCFSHESHNISITLLEVCVVFFLIAIPKTY